MNGQEMYQFAERIFPICRSITGNGVRETMSIIKEYVPELQVHEVPSGTPVFDWTVPREWNIEEAYIENSAGQRIIDFRENNLHVLGYSLPLDVYVDLEGLKQMTYTQKDQPEVIPYVTSYYRERSGFCMSQRQLDSLPEDTYHCVIKSSLQDGSLTYGEVVFPGKTDKEIFFSTYTCHPSMANNECSGPALAVGLIQWVRALENREYTYRFLFIPETIGSITYLSKHMQQMKDRMLAGFNLSCVGDNREYSFVATRYGNSLTDRLLRHVLHHHAGCYKEYSFLERGSDERQYNAPGVDLPVCSFSRSKYGEYPEYHTSADDLTVVSPEGFQGSLDVLTKCIRILEHNKKPRIQVFCEPQLGKRGLYPTVSQKGSYDAVKTMTNFIAYADGRNSLLEIGEIIGADATVLVDIANKLAENGLVQYE